ncbi:hypothetical protein BGZ60DRAFT_372151 [Tricladium varicosporioides]|nr:hypothetical protein BGZ60DRAFT_372151 [Hymenoscyphus varicosporioides]
MAIFSFVADQWALGFGAIFLLSSIAALAVNKHQRGAALNKLHFKHRRTSGASTPPRSLSPEKSATKVTSVTSTPDYTNTFPPSRRSILPELAKESSPLSKKILLSGTFDDDFPAKDVLPIDRCYETENQSTKYTPTGFTTEEVKALGDFPAYDVLSGVPLPAAYENFDPEKAIARPYRPFRWAYHQTMSFYKMETDWWLEVENTYTDRVKERQGLFRDHGSKVLDFLPGSELVCKELMEMCLQFYCARYPQYFSLSADKKTFHNGLLHTETNIKSMHPLHVLLNNVPEDFAIVLRNEKDGQYYFRAGVVCSSLGWNVGTKIGMNLQQIHVPIPDYKEKMSFSMDRYFSKMPTNTPIQRGSWGLEIGTPLFMPAGHPHEKFREMQKSDLTIDECYLRVDWQTLRRLPLSAGIVFNFKALFTPVQEFRDEPYIPALVLKILNEGKKNLMEYKNTWHVEHVCKPALEQYAREQIEKGWVVPESADEEEWTVATLAESPYYPGWEKKWHAKQGF